MVVRRRQEGEPSVLCKSSDEPGRAEVHHYGTRSLSSSLRLQEIPALSARVPDHLPHGS